MTQEADKVRAANWLAEHFLVEPFDEQDVIAAMAAFAQSEREALVELERVARIGALLWSQPTHGMRECPTCGACGMTGESCQESCQARQLLEACNRALPPAPDPAPATKEQK